MDPQFDIILPGDSIRYFDREIVNFLSSRFVIKTIFALTYPECIVDVLNQVVVPVEYKGLVFDEPLKLDLFVDDCLILELKAVVKVLPIHKAQLLSYMKLMDVPLGLLINFHELRLVDGVQRLVLPGADGSAEASKGHKIS